jgi:5-methylcytosine-specific restriction endonuclease McrA
MRKIAFFTLQIDHIISVKHGGAATLENLAVACIFCNRQKGSDVSTILAGGKFTRFFNPRTILSQCILVS